ncbi:hypothetical protein SLS56_011211 [Neofusicoccum ribis]|uniref:Initiation-specific alpha-1,6-mannosyltransferase n=1 Tax=Neofusicoccum ribis TaxID=45134 RepID=A0ABR3SC88_9PEZI
MQTIWHHTPDEKQAFVGVYQEQWKRMNPNYRYNCLTGETEDSFVYKAFRNDRGVRKTYDIIKYDPILRADFLRYLVLLAEGGVYTDIDTRPIQPIENWVPQAYLNRTNIVVGVEIDQRGGPLWRNVPWTVQMSQFTIMAKPRHPLIQRVVENVEKGVEQFFQQQGPDDIPPKVSFDDVIGLTGPRVFTTAVFQYLFDKTGLQMNGEEISGLKGPFLVADVLIQPVNGFASGQLHSESGTSDDPTALVSHKWMSMWVPTHPH